MRQIRFSLSNEDTYEGMGEMSEKDGQQAQAAASATVKKLVKAIDANPKDAQLVYQLATVLTEMQDYEQAEELLMKMLGQFHSDLAATDLLTYGLGNVYYQAAAYDQAAQTFAKVRTDKRKLDAYLMLAETYIQQKDYQKAFAFALTVHDQRATDPVVNALLGDILLAMGNFQQAADFYDQALAKQAADGRLNFNRGLVAMALGQDEQPFMVVAKKLDPAYVAQSAQRVNDIATLIHKHESSDPDQEE